MKGVASIGQENMIKASDFVHWTYERVPTSFNINSEILEIRTIVDGSIETARDSFNM